MKKIRTVFLFFSLLLPSCTLINLSLENEIKGETPHPGKTVKKREGKTLKFSIMVDGRKYFRTMISEYSPEKMERITDEYIKQTRLVLSENSYKPVEVSVDADLVINIMHVPHIGSVTIEYLTGLTFGIIPTWPTRERQIYFEFKNTETGQERLYWINTHSFNHLIVFPIFWINFFVDKTNDKYRKALNNFIRYKFNPETLGEKFNLQDEYLAYFYLALKYKDSGEIYNVLLNLNKSIKLNPSFFYAYMNRGVIYGYLGKNTHAQNDFSNAIRLKPNLYFPYRYRGKSYQKSKEYARALADYDKALILKPKDMHVLLDTARLFYDQSQYQQAFSTYEQVRKLYWKNAKVLDEYAWALIMCNNLQYKNRDQALQLATQAVKIFPCSVSYDTQAAVYANHKNFKKAIKYQKKAIEMMYKNKSRDYRFDNSFTELNERLKLYKQKKIWKEPKGQNRAFTINP